MGERIWMVVLVAAVCFPAIEASGCDGGGGVVPVSPVGGRGKAASSGASARSRGGGFVVVRKKKDQEHASGSQDTSSEFQKWPLPEEVAVRQLDSRYDLVLKTLNLEEEQEKAIQDARSEILKHIASLQEAQTAARSAYQSCENCPSTAAQLAARVKSADGACKMYDPNREYQLAIRRQLSLKQEAGFQKALSE